MLYRTVRSTKYQKLSKKNIPGLEFTEVNDLATDDLTAALKGVSVVMHVAAPLPGKADAAGSIKTAVEGTLNVVRHAEKAGITKIVVTSTFGNMFPRQYKFS
jgi:nucleoside-diphosphate-sugar epimerase